MSFERECRLKKPKTFNLSFPNACIGNLVTVVRSKTLDPSPSILTGARWDDMFVYALLGIGYF